MIMVRFAISLFALALLGMAFSMSAASDRSDKAGTEIAYAVTLR